MFGNLFGSRKYIADNPMHQGPEPPSQAFTPQNPVVSQPSVNIAPSPMEPNVRQGLSVLSHLDTRATQVLNASQQETKRIKQALIEPDQLMTGLLYDGEIFKLSSQFSQDPTKIVREIQGRQTMGTFVGEPTLSDTTKKIFDEAYAMVKGRGVEFITPEDLLLSLFSQTASANTLENQGIKKEDLEKTLSKSSTYIKGRRSALESYGVDLTLQAKNKELDPVAGRDAEIERVIHILLRRTKNNPIVIGEAGVGKTAVVEGLALKIIDGTAPKDLLSKKIIQLDLSSLV